MTYNDYISFIGNSGIGMAEFIPYLNSAYKVIVNRIKIDPVILPIYIDRSTLIDQFNEMARMVGSNSEIAFKEIIGFPKSTEVNRIEYPTESNQMLVGNSTLPDFGLSGTVYNDLEIAVNGSEIVASDLGAKLLIHAYMYPYFIRTVDGYKVDTHVYDVEQMINDFSASDLIVDDFLLYPVTLKALADYAMNCDNIVLSSSYDKLCNDLLNEYNKNFATLVFDTTTGISK